MKLCRLGVFALIVPMAVQAKFINLETDPVYKEFKAKVEVIDWVRDIPQGKLPADVFLEAMRKNIKKAIFEVINATVDFIEPRNPAETFAQCVAKIAKLVTTVDKEVIQSLQNEIAVYGPGIERNILLLTQEMVSSLYTKFLKMYQVLKLHLDTNDRDATKLVERLRKAGIENLIKPVELEDLAGKLKRLGAMLRSASFTEMAKDIDDLHKLVSSLQSIKTGQLSAKDRLKIFALLDARLKRG